MLEIKQVRHYKVPKYPKRDFYESRSGFIFPMINGGILSAGLTALVLYTSCNTPPIGVTGPPPLPPTMITEQEARIVINKIFSDNNVSLTEDVPFSFVSNNGTVELNLDGYNKILKIGYEYLSDEDLRSNLLPAYEDLKQKFSNSNTPPIIKVFDAGYYYTQEMKNEAMKKIEDQVTEFIKSLRLSGNL
jgi:hypothetical protein